MTHLLYKMDWESRLHGESVSVSIPGTIVRFSPFNLRWFKKALFAGRAEYLKVIVLAVWSVLLRLAHCSDFRIWAFVDTGGRILHYSVVSPAVVHMPWLGSDASDAEIGGCVTVAPARGQRVYPFVLQKISEQIGGERSIYMIVEKGNTASRAGMERAGYALAQSLRKERRLGRPPLYVCAKTLLELER